MIRTQIQLTPEQAAMLRGLAERDGVSLSEVVRRLVEQTARSISRASGEERRARAVAVAGRFSSGRHDVSAEHDRHLSEAITG